MRDFGLALDTDHFRDAVGQAADRAQAGDSVLLHCAAGIGRTGTFAACLLKRLGCTQELALQRVRMAGANPQSALQSGLIGLF
jgi:protein-tyrosine phosphatase